MLAGGLYYLFGETAYNKSYYLYTGQWFSILSPISWYGINASIFSVSYTGDLSHNNASDSLGVRPVINLKNTTMVASGSGTETDPYVVD